MSARAPLLSGHTARSIVTWGDDGPLTAEQFCGAIAALGLRLPELRHAINLCERGPSFMLASAAAWMRGHTMVLPYDRVPRTLERMRRDFADAYCVCDTPAAERAARDCGFSTIMVSVPANARPQWPPPALPVAFEAAYLHTSGSTGNPTRHCKTWGELVGGAATLAHAFGFSSHRCAVLGTVAPQHMFGFETTIMLPLQAGVPLLPAMPALPHDVAAAMRLARSLGAPRAWLFTTPLQLRAFHSAGNVHGLAGVVTATMPLDRSLASSVEQDWDVPVEEIYGCTEGGMLASRRITQSDAFTPGTGIRFCIDAVGNAIAAGGHLASAVPLGDRIEIVDAANEPGAQRIRLLGRGDDLVKVAGKRASLAGLTSTLKAIAGVEDGAFFVTDDTAKRLCAAVVAPGKSIADVRQSLASAIDAAFLPRPLLLVDELPRTAGGKVSTGALRELALRRSGFRAEVIFRTADPVFAGHFPGRPIVPGVLLLERVESELTTRGYRVREVSGVKFHAVAGPEQRLDIRMTPVERDVLRFEITRDAARIASGVVRCDRMAAE